METDAYDSVDEMLAAYTDQQEVRRRWSEFRYSAPADFGGTVYFYPLHVTYHDDGSSDESYRVAVEIGEDWIERRAESDYHLPEPDEVAELIHAVIQRANPARDREQDRLVSTLQNLAAQQVRIGEALKRTSVEAVHAGVMKTTVAEAAQVARTTLDRWLKDS